MVTLKEVQVLFQLARLFSFLNPGCEAICCQGDCPMATNELRVPAINDSDHSTSRGDLLRISLDLQDTYRAESIYAFKDETHKNLLIQWNRGRDNQPRVYSSSPPHSDTNIIEYHINVIKSKLYPDKHLFFHVASKLPGCLNALSHAEVRHATEDKYPEVVALGYTVAGLAAWSGGEIRQDTYETEYDFFAY